jgi:hypothetical protein
MSVSTPRPIVMSRLFLALWPLLILITTFIASNAQRVVWVLE